ncbi:Helix-turn-helix [Dyadobacter soli]|uniref:Helix-turn-helix n=1 Tax=Dyadobacter soli TaxID=659014 RepID=A0A1G6WY61_9BACT|nr:helix-turn-helix transcriptional regulator [Dyadobacter soli]SDD70852.1 Helix-turn-helix [Dyadobacter soli]
METSATQRKWKEKVVRDTEWVRAAAWRQQNEYWLDMSSDIALEVLSTLRAKGMTQREFAELMGCSPQYISKILKGSENLTLETICKMEKVLQIKLIETPYSHLREEPKPSSQQAQ